MDTTEINDISFDEKKSLQVMKAAIASSKNALMDDGILLILWGAALCVSNIWNYYKNAFLTAWWMRNLMDVLQILIGVTVIGFTIYFIFFKKRKVTTFAAISTRFVWIGVILAHNINILITKSILSEINFVLLQPLQMVLIGFALFVTGGIYRYYLLVAGGVLMWIAAAIAGHFELNNQFLIRSVAEFICFVVPGTLMYSARKNTQHV
jgi:hypothetical protein